MFDIILTVLVVGQRQSYFPSFFILAYLTSNVVNPRASSFKLV